MSEGMDDVPEQAIVVTGSGLQKEKGSVRKAIISCFGCSFVCCRKSYGSNPL